MRVGVLGLGRMGSIVAERLAQHYMVTGWDIRSVAIDGVTVATGPADLVQASDLVLSFLPSPDVTAEIVQNDAFQHAFSASATVFADCSTSDPASIRRVAETLGQAGARIVDAPILGRPDRIGAWTIPVGGDSNSVTQAVPVLNHLAETVEHVGPLGVGHTIKLLNNLMFSAINVVSAEAVGACSHLGIDPDTFVRLVSQSNAATVSPLFRDLAPRMTGQASGTVFTTALLRKDLSLAVGMCEAAGVPLRLSDGLLDTLNAAMDEGLGDEDSAALVRLFEK